MSAHSAVEGFIARWTKASGSERANYQLFISELCRLLDVQPPQPAMADAGENAYVFERRVTFRHGDGSESAGFIDCYRRGAFVLEAKKLKTGGAQTFDDALLRARAQAENYARALPSDEGRPPFLVIVDVGNVIELYSEFSRSGATYTPYPDPRSHRITIADFLRDDIRERLRLLFTDPLALDPSRQTARVTREIAAHLAELAKSLESAGHAAESVAGFLTRCLFSMFAEDVALIPKGAFSELLKSLKEAPEQFAPMIGELWRAMDKGEFSIAIRAALPRFNGKLFKSPEVLPLTKQHIQLLIEAAKADWTQVEPAIFGTLLERALDPQERHALGAHYTPRAYVERLVLPTVIEPLRRDWGNVQAAAVLLANANRHKEAVAELRNFHHRLCSLRVLDPACGSGNFLYVTLEHMKRLEGEVLNQLHDLGETQSLLEAEGLTVDPHQFLGLELNPRAAAIAELVLWIGYLQWHFRTQGSGLPPSPILKDFHNIECADAVLAFDSVDFVLDDNGIPVSRWDGRTFKTHPVTGEPVPDESARMPLQRYNNPRRAVWPAADVVIGNPPFIGASTMRAALGDGYVDALRSAWGDVPESADFVMFWWHHAAQLVAQGEVSRFGFITTNSLRQTFNRRIVQAALDKGLHLAFAIPDHPWVENSDGAAVRIAMTVAARDAGEGRLCTVSAEREVNGKKGGEGLEVELTERSGSIHADLSIGANIAAAQALRANEMLTSRGLMLFGAGFIVTPEDAAHFEADAPIKPYRNGRDLTDRPRDVKLIDLFGFAADEVRRRWPAVYQWVLERVKPERDHNRDKAIQENWWLHGRSRPEMRAALAGLPRYIATVETAKHRTFQFLDAAIAPDNKLVCIALDDAYCLGILSSRVHVVWAMTSGSWLGVGNDSVYAKSRCFETFPFPATTPEQQARIRDLAEQIDAHRKRVLAAHDDLTLTGLYNVLEKLKIVGAGDTANATPLTAKERVIHDKGLVAVLHSLHIDLDAAVLDAYGWNDLASRPSTSSGRTGVIVGGEKVDAVRGEPVEPQTIDETLLERLVALNRERMNEEAQGQIRWLRPSFQNPAAQPTQQSLPATPQEAAKSKTSATSQTTPDRQPWPITLPEQMAAIANLLANTATPLDMTAIAAHFTGKAKWKSALPEILATLEALGRARQVEGGLWVG